MRFGVMVLAKLVLGRLDASDRRLMMTILGNNEDPILLLLEGVLPQSMGHTCVPRCQSNSIKGSLRLLLPPAWGQD